MAEKPRITKIKLKFKNQVKATIENVPIHFVGSELGASKRLQFSQRCKVPDPAKVQEEARRKRELLKGYLEPSALPTEIVAVLCAVPHQLLPQWDDSLAIPEALHSSPGPRESSPSDRPAKKSRLTVPSCPPACSPYSNDSNGFQPSNTLVAGSAKHDLVGNEEKVHQPSALTTAPGSVPAVKGSGVSEHVAGLIKAADKQGQVVEPNSSSSEQATTTCYQELSPTDNTAVHCKSQLLCKDAAAAPHQANVRQAPEPSTSQRKLVSGSSVESQAGAGTVMPFPLLPINSSSELSCSYSSIAPFELQLPCKSPFPATQELFDSIMMDARACKHAGDAEVVRNSRQWSISAAAKYALAVLRFMEACEYKLLLGPSNGGPRSVQALYIQTADLAAYTVKSIETISRGQPVAKEALRILCEQVGARCYARAAVSHPHYYKEQLKNVSALLEKHRQHQARHAATAAGLSKRSGAAAGKPAGEDKLLQHSPDDSTTSSQDVVGNTSVPQFMDLGPLAKDVAVAAKHAARSADLVARSAHSFQAFIERADVRQNHEAKLACMHMAAAFMDMGMMDPFKVVAHAQQALVHAEAVAADGCTQQRS